MNKRTEILEKILLQTEDMLCDEETMQLLLKKKYSKYNYSNKTSIGQKAADLMAKVAGSWSFILIFALGLGIWIYFNIYVFNRPFDPFPFVLLNLVLSCVSAFQAPLIMMAQNRQDEMDCYRSQEDYIVNLKSEVLLEDMYHKIEMILKNQEEILKQMEN
ncbi:MAG: DUF1003 domain-containing protein [Erysipelotrichaceae bacterium]|nr:DUF1003 domain-containing protein [Erysipelotrichaceae bacterium]